MIPVNTTREVEANIPNSVHNAQIEVNGMAFKVLSSNLYTDRILAIVRELSCNAWDAHAMVGKTNIPFEVSLPSELNSELRIRDFGPGLSKADLPRVYTTFFGSTKRDSNDQIGGFGLGSKSPLSYTDAFTVSSYRDGVVCTYAIFLQKDGSPGVTMVNETTTDQPNGLEVIVPVEPRHVGEFCDRAPRALRYFPTLPVVKGAEITPADYTTRTEAFGIRTSRGVVGGLRVIMGHVAYGVTISALDAATRLEFRDLLNYVKVDIFMPIGSLEIQPSREALSYDETTKRKLHKCLEHIQATLLDSVQNTITKCKTYPDAVDAYRQARQGLSYRVLGSRNFTWRNRVIHRNGVLTKIPAANLATIGEDQWRRGKPTIRWTPYTRVINPKYTTIVWHDMPGGAYVVRLQHNRTQLGEEILLVRGDKIALRTVLKQLGVQRFVVLSQLPAPPAEAVIARTKCTAFGQIDRAGALRSARSAPISAQELLEKDANGELVWAATNGTNISDHDGISGDFLRRAISLVDDLYRQAVTIATIPRSAKRLEKTLHSHVLPYLHAQLDRYEIENDVPTQRAAEGMGGFLLPYSREWLALTAEYRGKHPQSTLAKFVTTHKCSQEIRGRKGNVAAYTQACGLLARTPIPARPTTIPDVAALYEELRDQYPLLEILSRQGWGSPVAPHIPHVTQYLEAIDNERNALLHPERTVTHNFLRGRPQKRQSRAQQMGADPRGAPRRAVRRDPRSHRPANRPTAIC